jgi:hypothetical protein
VSIVIILVALVILGGVVVVAMGRGGELARDRSDAPDEGDFESSADVASYRPPAALLGYHAGATERALQLIGRTIADRDAEISWLRSRLRELQPEGERRELAMQRPSGPDIATTAAAAGRPERGLASDQLAQANTEHPSPVASGSPSARTGDEG